MLFYILMHQIYGTFYIKYTEYMIFFIEFTTIFLKKIIFISLINKIKTLNEK